MSVKRESPAPSGRWAALGVQAAALGMLLKGGVFAFPGVLLTIGATLYLVRTAGRARLAAQSHQMMQEALQSSELYMVVRVDRNNRFLFVNAHYCRFFDKEADELLGSTFIPLIHEADIAPTLAAMEKLRQPPHRVVVEQRAYTRDGWRWLSWEDTAAIDDDGEIVEICGIGRDITDIRQAQENAEAASRSKSAFLATMSHEMRTPMNGVIGMTSLLQDTELSDQQRDYVATIRSSGMVLLEIINDVLDLSKIEASKLELEIVDFSLQELLDDFATVFSLRATQKGLDFQYSLGAGIPLLLRGDPGRLRQILTNFVDNAIKFTDVGEVHLDVEKLAEDQDQARLRFRVSDTGVGIAKEKLDSLFEAFTQGDVSVSRRHGGTGLGLAICQQLALLMGGSTGVDSQPGKGSCFWLEVPLEKSPAKATLPVSRGHRVSATGGLPSPGERERCRILVAEDNVVNQRVIAGFLNRLGLRADLVCNGAEVLEAVSRVPYDLVLMDVSMPEMDGLEATRRLRDREARGEVASRHARALPVIAMTAHVMQGDREHCLAIGMNDYLAKPISSRQLSVVLERWLGEETTQVTSPD